MSVGSQLGIDEGSALLDHVRDRWPVWVASDVRLGVVAEFDDLRPWLISVEREASDEVLLALAMLAAPDGGDDSVAAAALAKCLLPGACRMAGWLSSQPPTDFFRDSQPVAAGAWSAVERIDELVASQLWIEVRTFQWRRLRKVAANVLMNTRAGVLREVGHFAQVSRLDRTWANTTVVGSFSEDNVFDELAGMGAHGAVPGPRRSDALLAHSEPLAGPADLADSDDHALTAADELAELLTWAYEHGVISDVDRGLLLCLVNEAAGVETRNLRRGYGGLLGNELSSRVAPRVGVSEATVRRHASRSVRALAEAAPRRFRDDA